MKKIFQPRELDRVVILGMGASGYNWVRQQYSEPFDFSNPRQMILGINNTAFVYRCSAVVFMDDLKDEKEVVFKSLDAVGLPVCTSRAYDEWAFSENYPLKDVVETFNDVYLTNSIAYAVAWALLCFVKFKIKLPTIELYGCDFNYEGGSNPWERGRGCVEWWLRHAKHLGCELKLPEETLLLDTARVGKRGLYGYRTQPEFELVKGRWTVVEREWVEPPEEANQVIRKRTPEAEAARDLVLAGDTPPVQRFSVAAAIPGSQGL